MTAYDPTSGELRAHYAGFFDPGFGYDPLGVLKGSRAALEMRAHDVPFVIEHGQHVCRLTFERMLSEPAKLYGQDVGSNYQGQVDTLSKHFRRENCRKTAVADERTVSSTCSLQNRPGTVPLGLSALQPLTRLNGRHGPGFRSLRIGMTDNPAGVRTRVGGIGPGRDEGDALLWCAV